MTIIIAVLVAPFVLLTLCFALELFVGLRPLTAASGSQLPKPTAAIVVPAHDEEKLLRESLEVLKVAAADQARILLVADNCSDSTASIGREVGVEVIERNEPDRRGKGFALDFARAHLTATRPDVVIIVDADCSIDRASLTRLIRRCEGARRPCQATNLQRPALHASTAVQLSTFAFFIKNVVRQRALKRLANRVHLLGTGMAFPWPLFAGAELATSNIVEDLTLGQQLADAGTAPLFIEDAVVWSDSETDANTISQRRRWEGGFLANLFRSGPRMFAKAIMNANPRLMWAAVNIMIPPLALLMLIDIVILMAAGGITWFASAQPWPVITLGVALLTATVAIALAWYRGGSRFVTLRTLSRVPIYIAWKLPMYFGFATRGVPKQWLRTDRS